MSTQVPAFRCLTGAAPVLESMRSGLPLAHSSPFPLPGSLDPSTFPAWVPTARPSMPPTARPCHRGGWSGGHRFLHGAVHGPALHGGPVAERAGLLHAAGLAAAQQSPGSQRPGRRWDTVGGDTRGPQAGGGRDQVWCLGDAGSPGRASSAPADLSLSCGRSQSDHCGQTSARVFTQLHQTLCPVQTNQQCRQARLPGGDASTPRGVR